MSVTPERPVGRKIITEHGLSETLHQFETRYHLDHVENSEYMRIHIAYWQSLTEIAIVVVITSLIIAVLETARRRRLAIQG
jgi:hypothetical protein